MRRSKTTWWGLFCLACFIVYVRWTARRRRERIEALERALFPEWFPAPTYRRLPSHASLLAQSAAYKRDVWQGVFPDIPSTSALQAQYALAEQRALARARERYHGPNTLEYELKRRHEIYQQLAKRRKP